MKKYKCENCHDTGWYWYWREYQLSRILQEIDKEVERCENLITDETEDAWMNRIQGLLYARRIIQETNQQSVGDE